MKKLLSLTVVFLAWTMIMCQGSENLKNFQKASANECGHRNINGLLPKLSGDSGIQTKYREFPWMVSVFRVVRELNIIRLCGGSVIQPNVILTAAHCVYNVPKERIKVRAGEWDVQNGLQVFPIQDRYVAQVIGYKNFTNRKRSKDIALLILSTPLEFTENVNSICLPTTNTQLDYQRCVLTGWSKTYLNDFYQSTLTKIDLPDISINHCQPVLREKDGLGEFFELDFSFLCTAGKYTCDVFGGSPLVCPIVGTNDRYAQVGLVAWDRGCAEEIRSVYLNISNLKSWIDDQLKFKRIDGASFTSELTNTQV